MATINLELRNRPDKNGFCPVRVIIQDRGKRVYMPLPLRVLPAHWDKEAQRVKSVNKDHESINKALRLRLADLQASLAKDSLLGTVSLEKVAGRSVHKTLFMTFAGACLDRWERTKAPNSIKAYRSMLAKVLEFDPRINIEDISPDWLSRYEDHCWTECGPGGTLKRVAFVSVILKEAIRKGIIERDPFLIYKKPAKVNPPRQWLTVEEINRIVDHLKKDKHPTIQVVGWWFLFGCYTGLRYSDMVNFNFKRDIQEGRIVLYTAKTKTPVSIKINKQTAEVIERVRALPKLMSNQKYNQYLKALAALVGIEKNVTAHLSRHTFSMTCANLGFPIEVVAKLLGHTNLKTTAIYFKLTDKYVDGFMDKMDYIS